MKRYKQNHGIMGNNGEVVKCGLEVKEGQVTKWGETTGDIFMAILGNCSLQTQNDSIQGGRCYQAIESAKGKEFIEIEEGTHDWLVPIAEKVTPPLFRINGNLVYLFVKDGFEKAQQPKET